MTDYVLLWSAKGDGEWTQLPGHHPARSDRSAIRAYAEKDGTDLGEGFYAAVPLRSFKPVSVKVETKTALKFS